MIFLRTSSFGFGQTTKSHLFGNLLNSFQWGTHRASLYMSVFSYYTRHTAGYTFIENKTSTNPNFCAKTLLVGVGFDLATFEFNGSGDSGDFDLVELDGNLPDDQFNHKGMFDTTHPEHDLAVHELSWNQQIMGDRSCMQLIEDLAYQELETRYGGWEINAGSCGKVEIDAGKEIHIEYNAGTYYCEHCGDDYTEDEGCSCDKCCMCNGCIVDAECVECGRAVEEDEEEIEEASQFFAESLDLQP